MLTITIPAVELWDEAKQEFVGLKKEQTIQLEHSLISISKWESKWCKAFLTNKQKTREEMTDYVRCMAVTPNVDPDIFNYLTNENILQINKYIEAPMTATCISEDKTTKGGSREVVTSELIYYWMIALQIPIDECQKWHLNRLLTLIKVCNIKNQPPKKKSKKDLLSRNAALNAARRKQFNTTG